MTTYTIEHRTTHETFTVRAGSHEHAAVLAARRLYGRGTLIHRTTGDFGTSGTFAAHCHGSRLQAENQIGSEFHVR